MALKSEGVQFVALPNEEESEKKRTNQTTQMRGEFLWLCKITVLQ